jgi:hypothetical protein
MQSQFILLRLFISAIRKTDSCSNINVVASRSILANSVAKDSKEGSITYLIDCSQSIKIEK